MSLEIRSLLEEEVAEVNSTHKLTMQRSRNCVKRARVNHGDRSLSCRDHRHFREPNVVADSDTEFAIVGFYHGE